MTRADWQRTVGGKSTDRAQTGGASWKGEELLSNMHWTPDIVRRFLEGLDVGTEMSESVAMEMSPDLLLLQPPLKCPENAFYWGSTPYLMMTANGDNCKLKASCFFHCDYGDGFWLAVVLCRTHRILSLHLLHRALFLALVKQKRSTLSGYPGGGGMLSLFSLCSIRKSSSNSVLNRCSALFSSQHYWFKSIYIYSALLIAIYTCIL